MTEEQTVLKDTDISTNVITDGVTLYCQDDQVRIAYEYSDLSHVISLYAQVNEPVCLNNHGATADVNTGVMVKLPEATIGLMVPNAALVKEQGITINGSPVIVTDNQEIVVPLLNAGFRKQHIENGSMVARLIIVPLKNFRVNEVVGW